MSITKMALRILFVSFLFLQSTPSEARSKFLRNGSPWVFLIHGMFYYGGMDSMKKFLNYNGFQNVTIYSDAESPDIIAKDVVQRREQGHPAILMGHSQGGFNVVKVARIVTEKYKARIEMLVSLGAGGLGRLVMRQWFQSPRYIPCGVGLYYNFQTAVDIWGTDSISSLNQAVPDSPKCRLNGEEISSPVIVNRMLDSRYGVTHHDLPACFGRSGDAPSKNLMDQVCGPLLVTVRAFLKECQSKPYPAGCAEIRTPFSHLNSLVSANRTSAQKKQADRGTAALISSIIEERVREEKVKKDKYPSESVFNSTQSSYTFPKTTRWYSAGSSEQLFRSSRAGELIVRSSQNVVSRSPSFLSSAQGDVNKAFKRYCNTKFFTEKFRNLCYENQSRLYKNSIGNR